MNKHIKFIFLIFLFFGMISGVSGTIESDFNLLIQNCKNNGCSNGDISNIVTKCDISSIPICKSLKFNPKNTNELYYKTKTIGNVQLYSKVVSKKNKNLETDNTKIKNIQSQISKLNSGEKIKFLEALKDQGDSNTIIASALAGLDIGDLNINYNSLNENILIDLVKNPNTKKSAITQLEIKVDTMDLTSKKSLFGIDKGLNKKIWKKTTTTDGKLALCNSNKGACLQNIDSQTMIDFTSSDDGKKFINSLTKDEVKACISNDGCSAKDEFIKAYNQNQCDKSWLGCTFADTLNKKDILIQNTADQALKITASLNSEIDKLQKALDDCKSPQNVCTNEKKALDAKKKSIVKDYNKKLLNYVVGAKDNSPFEGLLKGEGACKKGLTTDCRDEIKNTVCDGATKSQCEDAKLKVDTAYDKTKIKTNALFGILSMLSNTDQNANNALRLFGIEPDYSNIPTLIKDPIASQLCSAKINGYLDKGAENGGGTTVYGCSNDKKYKYRTNQNTGRQTQISGQKCLNVLVDLRGQRTQITPDNKVSITYSIYLKAPSTETISYLLAISYRLKDGTIKKVLITPEFKGISSGSSFKDYQHILVPLNVSRNEIDDSQDSFKIGLLANFGDGSTYQHIVSPITKITGGDQYSGSTYQSSKSSGSQNINSNADSGLNPNQMANLIFG